jgi:hypothetical protein
MILRAGITKYMPILIPGIDAGSISLEPDDHILRPGLLFTVDWGALFES